MYKKRSKVVLGRGISNNLSSNLGSNLKFNPNLKFNSKKAQVTVFIILGIIMLLAIVLVLLLRKEVITFKPEELIPTEKGKVESFVTDCIAQLGDEALFKVGLQGGYIKVPEEIAGDSSQQLRLSPMHVLPYWAYGPTTRIPALLEIKERIDGYIQDNLRSCVLNWEPFKQEYTISEKSPITVNTEIVETKVIFNVHWDVEIKNKAGEVVTEVVDHVSESPVKLKKTYDTARLIVEKEMETLKLEDLTQDLIALEHPDVPVVGTEISCSQKSWDAAKVKNTLMRLISINIPQLKLKGTDYVEFPETLPYYQNHYVWDVGEEVNDPQINVNFLFDESYPFSFLVTPTSGGRMVSSQMGGGTLLSYLCLQTWKFTYDAVYPVKVRVRDETTGYDFNIAFTVHLAQNYPNRGESVNLLPERQSQLFGTASDVQFCSKRTVPMAVKTYELVENDEGVSYREDLSGVNVSFTCIRYRCEMGESEYDFANLGFSGFSTNFPYCVGGILRGTKNNYLEDWKRIVTRPNAEAELSLKPVLTLPISKFKVLKHEFNGPMQVSPGRELATDEFAVIKVSYRPNIPLENYTAYDNATAYATPYSPLAAGAYPEQDVIFSNDLSSLAGVNMLLLAKADFNYDLDIKLFKQNGEEATFIGGYKKKWRVPWETLQNANQIVFHTLSKDSPSEQESIELMLGLEQNSEYIAVPEIK